MQFVINKEREREIKSVENVFTFDGYVISDLKKAFF